MSGSRLKVELEALINVNTGAVINHLPLTGQYVKNLCQENTKNKDLLLRNLSQVLTHVSSPLFEKKGGRLFLNIS